MLLELEGLTLVNQQTLQKSITKKQAQSVHKDLPKGGVWRTISGHHIYILNGKIVAGSIPGVTGAKKATKAQLAEHQATIDKESKGAGKGADSSGNRSNRATGKDAGKAGTKNKKSASEVPAKDAKPKAKGTGKSATKKTTPKKTSEVKGAGKNGNSGTNSKKSDKVRGTAKQSNDKGSNKSGNSKTARPLTIRGTPKQGASEKSKPSGDTTAKATKKQVAPKAADKGGTQAFKKETVESTRKFTTNEYSKWFMSLPTSEQRKVMAAQGIPKSRYTVGTFEHVDQKQKILDAFHYLRAQAGLSETKAGTESKGVKDTRHKAQDNREVAYDVGQKVGGARKDLATISQRFEANPTAQDLEELEKSFPEAAQKLVTKKNLLKSLDFETEKNNGVEVNVAMAKKLVYDRIATEPATNSPVDRLLYFNALNNVQRVLEPIKTWDEFKGAVDDLGRYMRKEKPSELRSAEWMLKDAAEKLHDSSPSNYDLRNYGAAYDNDKEKWVIPKDAKKKWQADQQKKVAERTENLENTKKIQQAPMGLPLGEKLHNFFTDSESRWRTYDTISKKRLTWDKYFEDKENKPAKGASEGGERKLRPGEERAKVTVSDAKRVGGKKVSVQKPEDMVNTFGLRGVEFGNYVNDADGKHHLVKGSEAFQDLADILGMDTKDVSLNGRLAMSFGARGKGGALAHYEPVSKVINMTRDAGAGTLAHEWGHALDNIMHMQSTGKPSIGFAADDIGDQGDPSVKSAYEDVAQAMYKGNGKEYVKPDGKSYSTPYHWKDHLDLPFNEAFAKVRKDVDDGYTRQLDMNERYYANNPEKLKQGLAKTKDSFDKSLLNRYHALASLFIKNGKQVPDFERPTNKSQYQTNADQLCGGKQGYWNRKHEMFARAFESYVLDKLGAAGRRNDYLVAGTTHPIAYPQGEERKNINKAFDKLMGAVVKSKSIKKALEIMELQKGYLPDRKYLSPQEGAQYVFEAVRDDLTAEEAWDNIKKRVDWDAGEAPEFVYRLQKLAGKRWRSFICEGIIDYMKANTDEGNKVWDDMQKGYMTFEKLAQLKQRRDPEGIESGDTQRYAYNITHTTDPSEVLYIPVNRLKMVYQTDEATNWDKVKENMDKMKDGTALEPVVIGYDHDVHDGHHRWLAAKALDHTHVPCIVGGTNELDVQRAKEKYSELWKSIITDPVSPTAIPFWNDPILMYRGIGQKEMDFINKHGYIQTKGKGNDDDKNEDRETCFSNLYSQAEGYARSNYDLYNESQAYVLVLPKPPWIEEDEHGELVSKQPVLFDVGVALPIPKGGDLNG